MRILLSVPPGADVDLDGVQVTVGGASAPAEAVEADTQSLVRRTAVLAIDTSNSMRGARFEAAKQAARTYLAAVPDDVYVGVVSFADDVVPRWPRPRTGSRPTRSSASWRSRARPASTTACSPASRWPARRASAP